MKSIEEIIEVAKRFLGQGEMISSAKLCLDDSERLLARGEIRESRLRALKSLAYSIGRGHQAYRECQREFFEPFNPHIPLHGCQVAVVKDPVSERSKPGIFRDWDVWIVEPTVEAIKALESYYMKEYMLESPPKITILEPVP